MNMNTLTMLKSLSIRSFKTQSFMVFAMVAVSLTGCQTIRKAPALTPTPAIQNPSTTQTTTPTHTNPVDQKNLQNFKITGKIGVRTPKQNGSAFYGWTQVGEQFAIDLTGALGVGQTSIRGQAGDVTLTSSKTGTIHAATPEELLNKATGWEAPITQLITWVNGQPSSQSAKISKDSNQRITQIHEGGWSAQLSYTNAEQYPNKLVLIDDAQQNRVTLTIQTRE